MKRPPKSNAFPDTFLGEPARWLGMDEAETRLDPLGFHEWEKANPTLAKMNRLVAEAMVLVTTLRASLNAKGSSSLESLPEWARPRQGETLGSLSMDLLKARYREHHQSNRCWH